jgi:hypothetical protein
LTSPFLLSQAEPEIKTQHVRSDLRAFLFWVFLAIVGVGFVFLLLSLIFVFDRGTDELLGIPSITTTMRYAAFRASARNPKHPGVGRSAKPTVSFWHRRKTADRIPRAKMKTQSASLTR